MADSGEFATATERARLLRFCTRQTGDAGAADDLVQETLIEAWRHADRQRDAAAHDSWLFGIARNVCRRWLRTRVREAIHVAPGDAIFDAPTPDDPDHDLERAELVDLLDRALALLPAATRAALVGYYVEGLPQAEIAARLNLGEGAVAVRIHRGKLTLRRWLAGEGTSTDSGNSVGDWQETRIWCASCGRRRLLGRFGPENATFALRCPNCDATPDIHTVNGEWTRDLLAGLTSFKPALNRYMTWAIDFYRGGLATRSVHCHRCGRPAPLRFELPAELPAPWRDRRGVHFRCPCRDDLAFDCGLTAMTLWLPEGRRFWTAHPRLRTLPPREVETAGGPALVSTFESLTDAAHLDVVTTRDTYELIAIHGAPAV